MLFTAASKYGVELLTQENLMASAQVSNTEVDLRKLININLLYDGSGRLELGPIGPSVHTTDPQQEETIFCVSHRTRHYFTT